ncbi:MAG: hypothetical protein K6U14_02685 [Firmicutes bacterium]|nr:hypothetical protein [Alicyclobacillaceae bacterium]MCL6496527.1 hypothetical protein [Bacillota bacterium]
MRVAERYLDHLTDGDLECLAAVASAIQGRTVTAEDLRRQPGWAEYWIRHPATFEAIRAQPQQGLRHDLSPFLFFSAALGRLAQDLHGVGAVPEWVGPRQRLFVFDVDPLRQVLADAELRLFVAELLDSYTHVASGAVRVKRRGRMVRQRISELDPLHLVQWLEVARAEERPWLYRRLGDLALFLAGVFPDFLGRSSRWWRRWQAVAAWAGPAHQEPRLPDDPVRWMEALAGWCYRTALRLAPAVTGEMALVAAAVDRLTPIRRVVNVATDRYLLPQRTWWFPTARE